METWQDQSTTAHLPSHRQSLNHSLPLPIRNQKLFQCGLCSLTFDINMELVTHVHRHSFNKPFQCGVCKVSYENSLDLMFHVKTHAMFVFHVPSDPVSANAYLSFSSCQPENPSPVEWKSEETPYQGQGSIFHQAEPDLGKGKVLADMGNISAITEMKPTCSTVQHTGSEVVCENSWPYRGEKNVRIETQSEDEDVESDQCLEYDYEVKTEHVVQSADFVSTHQGDKSNEERPFCCGICDKSFRVARYMREHQKRMHKIGVQCADLVSKPQVSKSSKEEPVHCDICGKSFRVARYMKEHKKRVHKVLQSRRRKHSTEMLHKCADCGKSFKIKRDLNQHLCKPRECPVCQLTLNNHSTYEHHMYSKHSERKYQCSVCERSFSCRQRLVIHTRVHTKEKPYTCEFCGKSFAARLYLTYHQNSKHFHSRPYKCNLCQRGFNCHSSLSQHKRRHIGDKRYSCTQCHKKFYNMYMLRRHALTHSELRTYVCSVIACEKTYRSYSSLKYHLKHSHQM
ncbi:zinc finger protein 252-like [Littorina saxatilis]|uniref:C2H2-type domain-containing protein n=1 Tax=Littorina saxatilis TaxID=31220 RepID=A0AAN9G905_9CAEN